MRRFLLIAVLCLSSVTAYARNPPIEWKAYRMARVTADGKSSQEKVKIWSDYLAKYPESPYRERALEELEAASSGLWAPAALPCGSDVELDAALGVTPEPAPLALTMPDHLQTPIASNKKPLGAGLRSLGATYGGALLGAAIVGGLSSDSTFGRGSYAGFALWGAAVIAGPSAGHLYAGDKAHAKKMIAARAIATGVGLLGLYGGFETQVQCFTTPCPNSASDASFALAGLGFSAASVLMVYDLVDSFFVVQRQQGRSVKSRLRSYSAGF